MAEALAGSTVADMISTYIEGAALKWMLTTSIYVFDKHNHTTRASVTNEVSGTGYTAGGYELVLGAITKDTVNSRVEVAGDFIEIGPVTLADVGSIVLYIDNGSAALDTLLTVHSFPTQALTNEFFTLDWTESTIFYIEY